MQLILEMHLFMENSSHLDSLTTLEQKRLPQSVQLRVDLNDHLPTLETSQFLIDTTDLYPTWTLFPQMRAKCGHYHVIMVGADFRNSGRTLQDVVPSSPRSNTQSVASSRLALVQCRQLRKKFTLLKISGDERVRPSCLYY